MFHDKDYDTVFPKRDPLGIVQSLSLISDHQQPALFNLGSRVKKENPFAGVAGDPERALQCNKCR